MPFFLKQKIYAFKSLNAVCAVFIFLLLLGGAKTSMGQEKKDTLLHLPEHNPKKATILSALVPGLGQIYNQKYWKVPILYAGFAALGYFIASNNERYVVFKNASQAFLTDKTLTTFVVDNRAYTLTNLLIIKDGYRRNRDLAIIFTTIVYVLNILDANVDAHLFYFNVDDNLSLRIQPAYIPISSLEGASGVSLTLNFK
jgi:hypothetical protein